MKHEPHTTASPHKTARGAPKGQGKKSKGNGHSRDELVRLTAYSFYEARQGADGSDLEDWLRAEAQVNQLGAQSGATNATEEESSRAGLND